MAPSVQDIRRAVTKKRKAREGGIPAERKAVAKIPKKAGVGRSGTAEIVTARASRGNEEVRTQVVALAAEDTIKADASVGTVRGPTEAAVPPTPASPIILPDTPPSSAVRVPSPPIKTVGMDAAPAAEIPAPITTEFPEQDVASAPPVSEAPRAERTEGVSRAEDGSSPSRDGSDVDPSLRSLLDNHGRWAEHALKGASVVEIQQLLRSQDRVTFYREASVAHLWALNSLIAMKNLSVLKDVALDHAGEEMADLQSKVEKLEMALEDARSTWRNKAEAVRLRAEQAEYALETAQRKAANELDNALVAEENQRKAEESQREAEEKLKVTESRMQTLMDKLDSVTSELNIVTKKAERAEESARHADIEIAILKVAANESEREAIEAKEKASEAEGRAAAAEKKAVEAVDNFKKSRAFDKELADTTAFAYENGFQDCKDKIKRLHNIEGIEDMEPDEAPESDSPTP